MKVKLLAIGAGVAVVAVVGSVLALLTDSVTFDDNEFASGSLEYRAPIEGAFVGSSCADEDLVWQAPTLPGVLSDLDLQAAYDANLAGTGYEAEAPFMEICLRSNAAEDRAVSVLLDVGTSTELGDCGPSEVAAGDVTCGIGTAGELEAIIATRLVLHPESAPSCPTPFLRPNPSGPVSMNGLLEPGAVCRYAVNASVPNVAVAGQLDRVRAAETDRLVFDLTFVAEEVAA